MEFVVRLVLKVLLGMSMNNYLLTQNALQISIVDINDLSTLIIQTLLTLRSKESKQVGSVYITFMWIYTLN